jgi:hypothetical protein
VKVLSLKVKAGMREKLQALILPKAGQAESRGKKKYI